MIRALKKILIANRGEIALRIIRAARESGIATVGLYTTDERHSPWNEQCQESYSLGSGTLSDTYLNFNKIISIARQSGVDAIHPGYGFLSENYLLAEACELHHITFIGPPADILRLMADKISAHQFVESLGVSVPFHNTGTADELIAMKDKIAYPVLVKAVSGGGGKGMRMAAGQGDLGGILKTTSREALQYFGDDRVYLEQYLPHARHIEVQIIGDQQGNIRHLYERDCTVQRRHQKIIEEAPADILTAPSREMIIEMALKIAHALHYVNAGTIEFLLDEHGNCYFMEMNPRLQVEHGVTEMITGIDLVKEQISIAAGNPLSFDRVEYTGHSIEVRIYAEDPENDLLPSPGHVRLFRPPDLAGLRIETAVADHTDIRGEYDPLMAKILVHEPTRHEAVLKMHQAIEEFAIAGVKSNLPLLHVVLQHADYLGNNITTGFVEDHLEEISNIIAGFRKSKNPLLPILAATIKILPPIGRLTGQSPWDAGFWRNVRQVRFRYNRAVIEADYHVLNDHSVELYLQGNRYILSDIHVDREQLTFKLNGEHKCLYVFYEESGTIGILDGYDEFQVERWSLEENADYSSAAESSSSGGNLILAPQPGTILDIKVEEGQMVCVGDRLLTIESMKLENTILARRPGQVKKINIKAGDKVKKNEPLIYLQENITN
jgi:3-methylcrotonyl-CoA carboxylase alpha subunit